MPVEIIHNKTTIETFESDSVKGAFRPYFHSSKSATGIVSERALIKFFHVSIPVVANMKSTCPAKTKMWSLFQSTAK